MLDTANEQVSNDTNEVRGRIKLGLLPETDELVRPILFDFHDQYPHVELDIRNINNGFSDMFQQGLDIAFHGGALFDSDIVARKVVNPRSLFSRLSQVTLQAHGTPENSRTTQREHQCVCFRWPNGDVDNVWHFQEQSVQLQPQAYLQ